MNLKNVTIALIAALAYEILLKVCIKFIPSFIYSPAISTISSILFYVVSIIILMFFIYFYQEERSDKKIESSIKLLLICFIVHIFLLWPTIRIPIGSEIIRLMQELLNLVKALLLFRLIMIYKKNVLPGDTPFEQAAFFVTIMFGIGIIKSTLSLFDYTRYLIVGEMIDYPPVFYTIIFIVFLLTHLSMINFLYRYCQFKSGVRII
jgi:hypothetical protein